MLDNFPSSFFSFFFFLTVYPDEKNDAKSGTLSLRKVWISNVLNKIIFTLTLFDKHFLHESELC